MYTLKTARWQEKFETENFIWNSPTIKIAATNVYNGEPAALILDNDSIIFDNKNKREITFEEFTRINITDCEVRATYDRVDDSIFYCEVMIIRKWGKKSR